MCFYMYPKTSNLSTKKLLHRVKTNITLLKWKYWETKIYILGYYLYYYADKQNDGAEATMTSPQLPAISGGKRCLRFWYNMLNTNGDLEVRMKIGGKYTGPRCRLKYMAGMHL